MSILATCRSSCSTDCVPQFFAHVSLVQTSIPKKRKLIRELVGNGCSSPTAGAHVPTRSPAKARFMLSMLARIESKGTFPVTPSEERITCTTTGTTKLAGNVGWEACAWARNGGSGCGGKSVFGQRCLCGWGGASARAVSAARARKRAQASSGESAGGMARSRVREENFQRKMFDLSFSCRRTGWTHPLPINYHLISQPWIWRS